MNKKIVLYISLVLLLCFSSIIDAGNISKAKKKEVSGSGRSAAVATDSFPGGIDGDPISASNWTQTNSNWGNMQLDGSGNAYGDGNGVSDASSAVWSGAGSFTADQWVSAPVANLGWQTAAFFAGVGCRTSTDTNATRDGYGFVVHASVESSPYPATLYKVVNGTYTALNTGSITFANSDLVELECVGTEIKAMVNGVALGGGWTATDSDLSTGNPAVIAGGSTGVPHLTECSAGNMN